jgi:hypothetical protein
MAIPIALVLSRSSVYVAASKAMPAWIENHIYGLPLRPDCVWCLENNGTVILKAYPGIAA